MQEQLVCNRLQLLSFAEDLEKRIGSTALRTPVAEDLLNKAEVVLPSNSDYKSEANFMPSP